MEQGEKNYKELYKATRTRISRLQSYARRFRNMDTDRIPTPEAIHRDLNRIARGEELYTSMRDIEMPTVTETSTVKVEKKTEIPVTIKQPKAREPRLIERLISEGMERDPQRTMGHVMKHINEGGTI